MCARTEAERVRTSVSTFAPCATNSAILHLLGENAPSSGLNPIQVRYRTALRPEVLDGIDGETARRIGVPSLASLPVASSIRRLPSTPPIFSVRYRAATEDRRRRSE